MVLATHEMFTCLWDVFECAAAGTARLSAVVAVTLLFSPHPLATPHQRPVIICEHTRQSDRSVATDCPQVICGTGSSRGAKLKSHSFCCACCELVSPFESHTTAKSARKYFSLNSKRHCPSLRYSSDMTGDAPSTCWP